MSFRSRRSGRASEGRFSAVAARVPARPQGHATRPVATLLQLQATAGNAAMASLFAAQRMPLGTKPPAATASEAAADAQLDARLTAAEKLATPTWFGQAVLDAYASRPRVAADLVKDLAAASLHLPELADTKTIDDKALKKRADTLAGKLKAGVTIGLAGTMAAIAADLPARQGDLDAYVAKKLGNQTWPFGDLLADLWLNWLQCVPAVDAVKDLAAPVSKQLRSQLETSVRAYAANHFGTEALKALAPARGAVRERIEPLATWVTDPAALDKLTDDVMTAQKMPYKDHADPAWSGTRSKMADLVVVAEVDIIRAAKVPLLTTFDEPTWGKVRPMYASTIEKPIWKFFTDDITDFKVLGGSVGKVGGAHKALKPALDRVEASAARLGGASYKSFKATGAGGFRFEPAKGDFASKAHVSLHATGRAIDFDAPHNPLATGATRDVIAMIAGVDLDAGVGGIPSFGELAKIAAVLDATQAKVAGLKDKLSGDLNDQDRSEAQALLEAAQKEYDALPARADLTAARDRAGAVYDAVVKAQTEFMAIWKASTKDTGLAKDLNPDELVKRLETFKTAKLAPLDQQIDDAKKALGGLKTGDGPPAQDAKKAISAAQANLDGLVALRARRAQDIDKIEVSVQDKRSKVDQSLQEIFKSGGFTNLPKWMVQAFVENGFTWGGGWHDPADAMHFSYMAPIEGVTQPGMG